MTLTTGAKALGSVGVWLPHVPGRGTKGGIVPTCILLSGVDDQ